METGINNAYEWLETDHDLRRFLSLCPEAIVGKYLAITAVDSGAFTPSETDAVKGWKAVGNIAYSPRLRSTQDLPQNCCCRDCSGFDEWYVFGDPVELGNLCHGNIFTAELVRGSVFAFINFFFRPSDPKSHEITDLLSGCSPSRTLPTERTA